MPFSPTTFVNNQAPAISAGQQPGLQATKTGATGSFLTWGSNVSYNSTAIKVIVGMSAKSSG